VEAVVGEGPAVEQHAHQHAVVVDRAKPDHFALVEHLLLLAVHRAFDRDVGQRGEARRARRVPGVGERHGGGRLTQLVRGGRRHVGEAARALDAARYGEPLDEDALSRRRPAVVAAAKLGGGKAAGAGGRFVFHRRVYGK